MQTGTQTSVTNDVADPSSIGRAALFQAKQALNITLPFYGKLNLEI